MTHAIETLLSTVKLPAGCRKRMDCPECGGRNTLSLTHDERGLVWHCFKADCEVHGASGTRLTIDSFSSLVSQPAEVSEPMEWLPHYHNYLETVEAQQYIKKNNCTNAYIRSPKQFGYDVRQNRVMFLVYKDERVIDAAGRALDDRKPKWHRYGTAHEPFVIGDSSVAVVVEDCASACAVYPRYTGVAILGTSILPAHIRALQRYEKVIVALDKDASEKGIDIAHKLGVEGIDNEIVFLEEDLKRSPRQI